LIAKDDASQFFLCHTGRLAGGKRGIGKSAFIKWMGRSPSHIVIDDKRQTYAFPVAQHDSPRVIAQIAEYVRTCVAFKAQTSGDDRMPKNKLVSREERRARSEIEESIYGGLFLVTIERGTLHPSGTPYTLKRYGMGTFPEDFMHFAIAITLFIFLYNWLLS